MFNKIFANKNKESEVKELEASIRIIGDRAAGKTTYLAALARWPDVNRDNKIVEYITAMNEDGSDLIAKAKNILEQGDVFEPTFLEQNIAFIKDYTFRIILKPSPRERKGISQVALTINSKDYAGEFFGDLLHKANDPLLKEYIKDCLQASGFLLLIDGLSYRKDVDYRNGLEELLQLLEKNKEDEDSPKRIALVLTKCEHPELWTNRNKPMKVIQARFPKVKEKLDSWQKSGGGSVEYFMASAFGVFNNRFPEGNMTLINKGQSRQGGYIIKKPELWKPFGLVAPIYWLCSGNRYKQLDFE